MDNRRDLSYLGGVSSASEDDGFNDDSAYMEKIPIDTADIEAQLRLKTKIAIAPEYDVPTSTKYLYLILYFTLNLCLTLYNKAVLGKVCRL